MKSSSERTNPLVVGLGALNRECLDLPYPCNLPKGTPKVQGYIIDQNDVELKVAMSAHAGKAALVLGCLTIRWFFLGGAGQAGPNDGPQCPGRSHTCISNLCPCCTQGY